MGDDLDDLPVGGKSGYTIDWDKIDETSNPFQPRNKPLMGFSPSPPLSNHHTLDDKTDHMEMPPCPDITSNQDECTDVPDTGFPSPPPPETLGVAIVSPMKAPSEEGNRGSSLSEDSGIDQSPCESNTAASCNQNQALMGLPTESGETGSAVMSRQPSSPFPSPPPPAMVSNLRDDDLDAFQELPPPPSEFNFAEEPVDSHKSNQLEDIPDFQQLPQVSPPQNDQLDDLKYSLNSEQVSHEFKPETRRSSSSSDDKFSLAKENLSEMGSCNSLNFESSKSTSTDLKKFSYNPEQIPLLKLNPNPLVFDGMSTEKFDEPELAAKEIIVEELEGKEMNDEKFTSKEMIDEEFASKEMIDEEFTSKEMIDEEFTSKEMIDEELEDKKIIDEELEGKQMDDEEFASKEMIDEEFVSKEMIDEEFVSKEMIDEELEGKQMDDEEFVSKEMIDEELEGKQMDDEEFASKELIDEELEDKEIIDEELEGKQMDDEEFASKEMIDEELEDKEIIDEEFVSKEIIDEELEGKEFPGAVLSENFDMEPVLLPVAELLFATYEDVSEIPKESVVEVKPIMEVQPTVSSTQPTPTNLSQESLQDVKVNRSEPKIETPAVSSLTPLPALSPPVLPPRRQQSSVAPSVAGSGGAPETMANDAETKAKELEWTERMRSMQASKQTLQEDKTRLTATVDDMKKCIDEYERTLHQIIEEKSRAESANQGSIQDVLAERDQALEDLSTVEKAFGDLHRRFEKSKQVIDSFKQNEETLKHCLQDSQEKLKRQEQKYQTLKQHAEEKLKLANDEIDTLKRTRETEVTRLQAASKRAELQVQSLETQLGQKTKENHELTQICDELISKCGK